MIDENFDGEMKVVEKIIGNIREDLQEVLIDYGNGIGDGAADPLNLREKTVDEIINLFAKVMSRAGRFSDFKSKIKIMKLGEKLSDKEKERCNFIIKVNNAYSVNILKNTINEITGTFKKNKKGE